MGEFVRFHNVVGMTDSGTPVIEPTISFGPGSGTVQPPPDLDTLPFGEKMAEIDRQMKIADIESGAPHSFIKPYVMATDDAGHSRLQRVESFPAVPADQAAADFRVQSIQRGIPPAAATQEVVSFPSRPRNR